MRRRVWNGAPLCRPAWGYGRFIRVRKDERTKGCRGEESTNEALSLEQSFPNILQITPLRTTANKNPVLIPEFSGTKWMKEVSKDSHPLVASFFAGKALQSLSKLSTVLPGEYEAL